MSKADNFVQVASGVSITLGKTLTAFVHRNRPWLILEGSGFQDGQRLSLGEKDEILRLARWIIDTFGD